MCHGTTRGCVLTLFYTETRSWRMSAGEDHIVTVIRGRTRLNWNSQYYANSWIEGAVDFVCRKAFPSSHLAHDMSRRFLGCGPRQYFQLL